MHRLAFSLIGVVAVALSACRRSADDARTATRPTVSRGLQVGDSIAPFPAPCVRGPDRIVGERDGVQLVTLSTPGDCSTCVPHLAGLDSLAREESGPAANYLLVFAPGRSVPQVANMYASYAARDVCVDTMGNAWDALDVQKTPVTILLVSGRIAYMTAKGFLARRARERLRTELTRAQAR